MTTRAGRLLRRTMMTTTTTVTTAMMTAMAFTVRFNQSIFKYSSAVNEEIVDMDNSQHYGIHSS